jgi:ribosome recycling factor
MSYSFNAFTAALQDVENALKKEFAGIRTGHASPAVLDSVVVESYGARMPIHQVGTITLEGARALRVSVWDKNVIKAVERAIQDKDLGLSVSSDEKGVRIFFPDVTTEQKEKFVKLAKEKLEEARIRVRREREGVSGELQDLQKSGGLSEDEVFRLKTAMQKHVDEANARLNDIFERKEKEILST